MDKERSEKCFEPHIKILRLHGLWPRKKNTKVTVTNIFWRIIWSFPVSCLFLGAITHLVIKLCLNVNDDITDDIVMIFLSIFFTYTFFITSWQQNNVIALIEELQDFSEYGKPAELSELISKQKKITYTIYIYCQIGGAIYGVVCYLSSLTCEGINKVYGKTCGLPVPLFLPFKVDQNVELFILIIEMIICIYQILLPAVTVTYLAVAIMENIQLRLRHLREIITNLASRQAYKKRRDLLKFCFSYYESVLRFEILLEKCIGKAMAVHLGLSAIIIGILNYKIYYTLQAKDIIHLLGWIASMVLLCHAGQGLLNESVMLSTEIYCLPWYQFEPSLQRWIQMFLMRSQKPVRATAGIFYSFSYELLLAIANSSFSYMALLNQFSKRTNTQQAT